MAKVTYGDQPLPTTLSLSELTTAKFAVSQSPILTISAGSIVPTGSYHRVDTEGGAATDDLDNIDMTAFPQGSFIILSPVNNARDVVIKHLTGNIACYNALDITLAYTSSIVILFNFNNISWVAVSVQYPMPTFAQLNATTVSASQVSASTVTPTKLTLPLGSILTISSGSITPTGSYHRVDTEASAATDDLVTINDTNIQQGTFLVLQTVTVARDVVIKNGAGNIFTSTGSDLLLDSTIYAVLLFKFSATQFIAWSVTSPAALSALSTSKLQIPTTSTLTIASGAITPTGSYHQVDTEGAAATDDLTTINMTNLGVGSFLFLRSVNNSRDVTIKHGGGNIACASGADITLANNSQGVLLLNLDNVTWFAFNTTATPNFNTISATIVQAGKLTVPYSGSALTIAAGSITPTAGYHQIDTEGAAATDELATVVMTNLPRGSFLVLQTTSSARDVVIKHGVGNIYTSNGTDLFMGDTRNVVLLFSFDGVSLQAINLTSPQTAFTDLRPSTLYIAGNLVSFGANDSAGAGFRLVRVPNA